MEHKARRNRCWRTVLSPTCLVLLRSHISRSVHDSYRHSRSFHFVSCADVITCTTLALQSPPLRWVDASACYVASLPVHAVLELALVFGGVEVPLRLGHETIRANPP